MIVSGNGLIRSTPNKPKSGPLSFREHDSIAVLIAGNMSLQSEILAKASQILAPQLTEDRLSVDAVLNAYTAAYQEIYFTAAESAVLVPNLHTRETYQQLERQGDETVVADLRDRLAAFQRSFKANPDNGIETIIAGFDHQGAHLYKLYFDDIIPLTGDGYAVIGCGSPHADSHFQLSGYTSTWRYRDAIFLLYEAKKKAEIADSVGKETDMFRLFPLPLGPTDPTFQRLGDMKVALIAGLYDDYQNEIREISTKLTNRLKHEFLDDPIIPYVKESYEKWTSAKAAADDGNLSDDESGVRGDTVES